MFLAIAVFSTFTVLATALAFFIALQVRGRAAAWLWAAATLVFLGALGCALLLLIREWLGPALRGGSLL